MFGQCSLRASKKRAWQRMCAGKVSERLELNLQHETVRASRAYIHLARACVRALMRQTLSTSQGQFVTVSSIFHLETRTNLISSLTSCKGYIFNTRECKWQCV